MTFRVHELRKAEVDIRSIFTWLREKSPSGAKSWLFAYDQALDRLRRSATSFGEAPESAELELDVRQALFKTRRGRIYRVLFTIESQDIYVLRVRGPGQAPIAAEDIDSSP